jgi:uncharacterized protein (DUF302 family)
MITIRTKKKLADVAQAVERATVLHGFGVMGIHDLRAKMQAKGVAFEKGCLVFEVCNPMEAKTVLDVDMAISTALPCRISAYEVDSEVELATMEPTLMIGMFGHPELTGVANRVETTLKAIMNDAATN